DNCAADTGNRQCRSNHGRPRDGKRTARGGTPKTDADDCARGAQTHAGAKRHGDAGGYDANDSFSRGDECGRAVCAAAAVARAIGDSIRRFAARRADDSGVRGFRGRSARSARRSEAACAAASHGARGTSEDGALRRGRRRRGARRRRGGVRAHGKEKGAAMSVMRAVYGIGSLRGIGDDAALDPLGTALARMSDPNVSNEEKRELEALLNDLRNRAVVVRDKGQAPSTAPVVVPSNGGGG